MRSVQASRCFRSRRETSSGGLYCYHDSRLNKMILAPNNGGDGKTVGRCSQFKEIFAGFPAHYAPVDLMFYTGTQFPARYGAARS